MKFKFLLLLMCAFGLLNAQNTNMENRGNSFTIDAPQLKSKKNIWVFLPKNYDSTDKNFPVLYVMGGLHDIEGWNFEESLMNLKIKSIIIGIEHEGTFATLNEMDAYLDFIALTLKPHVDKTYRTRADSSDTGLFGTGTDGMMAFYGSIKYPQSFGRIGCFSPATGKYWQEIVNAMAKTTDFRLTNIYFLHGENAVEAAAYVEHWVNTKRCQCKKRNKRVYVKGGKDDAVLWQDGFKKAYLWLF